MILALSGGGIRGLALVGALHALNEAGALCEATHFVGTSIGALLSLLLALGFSCAELEDFGMTEDFAAMMDVDFAQALSSLGLNTGESLESRLREIVESRMGSRAPSLAEVAAHRGLDLSVTATCLESASVLLLSSTDPATAGLDAVRCVVASMRVPGMFAPDSSLLPGRTLLDGGLLCNFPMGLVLERFRGEPCFGVKVGWKDPGPETPSTASRGLYMERVSRSVLRSQEARTFETVRRHRAETRVIAVESSLSFLSGSPSFRRRALAIREAQTSARRDLRTLRETGLAVANESGRTAVAQFSDSRHDREPSASPEEIVGAMVVALAAAAADGTSLLPPQLGPTLLPTKHGRRRNSWTTFSRPLTSTPAP
jgi:NTE family protein